MNIALISDSASKGNGTYCGAGVVMMDKDVGEILEEWSEYTGIGTSNYSEYKALQLAIKQAIKFVKKINTNSVLFLCDSNLVVSQIKGVHRVKDKELKVLHAETIVLFHELKEKVKEVDIDQVGREFIARADELARQAAMKGSLSSTKKKYPFLKKVADKNVEM